MSQPFVTNARVASSKADFKSRGSLMAFRTFDSETSAEGPRRSRRITKLSIIEDTFNLLSKSLCNFAWLGQTVSINLKSNNGNGDDKGDLQ
jgi:hypothetical protein